MSSVDTRLRALVEAGIGIASELSLDALLERTVRTAAAVTGARYAALGVIDSSGRALERFVTHGLDEGTIRAIGELPRGRGILGVLIRDAAPLRLDDIADDPRSVGFPPNHPPMRTFLGVPILLRGVAYGNLYLTEKESGDAFTADDEDLAKLLAAQAAVAVENARLYESATAWSRQLESLNQIILAMASETELAPLLRLICSHLRDLLDARLVTVAVPAADGDLRIEAADGEDAAAVVGASLGGDKSKHGRVLQRRRSERVDSLLEDPEVDQTFARRVAARSALFVPLVVRDEAIGVLAAHDKRTGDGRFTAADLRLAELFAARAAVAVDLSHRVARDALRRALAAQELERRRLALELHDQTGQDLTSIILGLRAIEAAPSAEQRAELTAEVRARAVQTLQDVRRLAVELRPKALDDFGLDAALERLVDGLKRHTGIEVDLDLRLPGERLPDDVETTLYRVVQEALTNVVKHAQARRVTVTLARDDGGVRLSVVDDGRGFAGEDGRDDGIGLRGMRERLELVAGRLEITGEPGRGTTVTAEVPLP